MVTSGATLTIEPGTIIKGDEGDGSLASALIIARGAKIMAEGTADKPIIFTSILDDIKIGQKAGTTLDENDNQKWGGLIILGAAKISAKDGDTEASIEGIPADDAFGRYGGTNDADNSGILSYVSIRHGGALIGEGNEINGLTLGGVGSGTIIKNVEVFATFDDGVEFFGGNVTVENFIVSYQGDDGVDIDQNFNGTVKNFMVIHGGDTDEGTEIDGPENSTYTDGKFTLENGTFILKDGTSGNATDMKAGAQGTMKNCKFIGYADGTFKVAASFESDCMTPKADAFTHLTANPATLNVMNTEFQGSVKVYSSSCPNAITAAMTTAANAAITSASASGADASVFSWTLAQQKGLLN